MDWAEERALQFIRDYNNDPLRKDDAAPIAALCDRCKQPAAPVSGVVPFVGGLCYYCRCKIPPFKPPPREAKRDPKRGE